MRLLTYKAAARAAAGQGLRPRGRAGPQAVRRQGHADRPRRRPAARRPRLRQGAPGRAVVPRPPGHRRHGRRGARLRDDDQPRDPKKLRPLVDQAHQVAMNMLRPISRKYDRAEHEYPKELDMLAAMIDGLSESGAAEGAGAAGVRRDEERRGRPARQERHQPRLGAVDRSRCAGATSACCSRCRARASATPRSPRSPTTSSSSGSTGTWAAMAITEPGTGSDSANIRTTARSTATSTSSTARRSSSPPASAPTRSSCGRRSTRARPRGDQVVRGRRRARPGMTRRAARAQARHPRLRHRDDHLRGLPGAGGEPARLARRSTPSRASPARWRPSTTPARWSPRWPSAAPGPSLDLTRELLEQAGVDVDYDRPAHRPSRPRPRSSSRWRPTGRPRTC